MAQEKPGLISDEISKDIIEITKRLAMQNGAEKVTVSRILSEMGVTNRVFYNRFHNIDEVLEIVYSDAVMKMRESIGNSRYNLEDDFFEYIMDVSVMVLVNTYDIKMKFSRYMFEHDSLTEDNHKWWVNEVKKIIEYALEKGMIKKVEVDVLSEAMWRFLRGYNADAVTRGISKEDAVRYFKFGFGCFLDGIKVTDKE